MASTTPIYALPYPVPTDPADVPHDVQALAQRLEAAGVLAAEAWTAFTPGAAFQSPSNCGYRKEAAGAVVRCRGSALMAPGTPPNPSPIFTVPVGYRPAVDAWIVISTQAAPLSVQVVASSGVAQLWPGSLAAGQAVYFSGLAWSVG